MKKTLFFSFLFVAAIAVISSCKKEEDDELITEPITLKKPDSTAVLLGWGEVLPIEVKYATDRAINYVETLYEIDSSGDPLFVYTYPETLAHVVLDANPTDLKNIYTYTGNYTVPDSLPANTVIRFRTSFKAQNLMYKKEFKIVVQ